MNDGELRAQQELKNFTETNDEVQWHNYLRNNIDFRSISYIYENLNNIDQINSDEKIRMLEIAAHRKEAHEDSNFRDCIARNALQKDVPPFKATQILSTLIKDPTFTSEPDQQFMVNILKQSKEHLGIENSATICGSILSVQPLSKEVLKEVTDTLTDLEKSDKGNLGVTAIEEGVNFQNPEFRDFCCDYALKNGTNGEAISAILKGSNDNDFMLKTVKRAGSKYGEDQCLPIYEAIAWNHNASPEVLNETAIGFRSANEKIAAKHPDKTPSFLHFADTHIIEPLSKNPNLPDNVAEECIKFDMTYRDNQCSGQITKNIAECTKSQKVMDCCLEACEVICNRYAQTKRSANNNDLAIVEKLYANPNLDSARQGEAENFVSRLNRVEKLQGNRRLESLNMQINYKHSNQQFNPQMMQTTAIMGRYYNAR